jgi:hypothetical protein
MPLAADTLATRYNELHCAALPPKDRFDLSNLAFLFELSLGLSAWKSYGAQRWALRCNRCERQSATDRGLSSVSGPACLVSRST